MNILTSEVFGTILMLLWILYVTVGFVSQIIKNSKEKRFGWSNSIFLLAYITYPFGILYGFSSRDIYIFLPYTVGGIFLQILLYQFFKYRHSK